MCILIAKVDMRITLNNLFFARGIAAAFAVFVMAVPIVCLAFGTTSNSQVFAIAEQADGKIIIAGDFTAITLADNSVALRNRIARLNSDGSLDPSFNIGMGANSGIFAMILQLDGKILIGGNFTEFNGIMRNRIARLHTDGSVDTTFAGGTGFNGAVLSLALQPDGKLLAGGDFDLVRGNMLNNIARLNSDSSVDLSFDPGEGTNGVIRAVALQSNGKVVIGGDFTTVNTETRGRFARLDANGTLNSGFGVNNRANGAIHALLIQPDGKVVLGGEFTQFLPISTTRNRIARLDISGSIDATFSTGSGANAIVTELALQTGGKILIGGGFTLLRGGNRKRFARMNSDSSVDLSFQVSKSPDDLVASILQQSDGKILIGGFFANLGNVNNPHLARFLNNGVLDAGPTDGSEVCIPIKTVADSIAVVCL